MKDCLFLTQTENEDKLYRAIRDLDCNREYRTILEKMWGSYRHYAPKGFKRNLQDSFHSRWWEMYLTLGILQLGFQIETDKEDAGPDIRLILEDNPSLWIEAVAPSKGEATDRVPDQEPNTVVNMPRREGLLRLTQSISSKKVKFEHYIQESIIYENSPCIIALSACSLNLGETLDWPCPAPISILTGADNLTITSDGHHYQHRESLLRDSGSEVDTTVFEDDEYKIVSAILYSHHDPLSAPKPCNSLKLFLNPYAKNPIPIQIYERFKETWECNNREDDISWTKISANSN